MAEASNSSTNVSANSFEPCSMDSMNEIRTQNQQGQTEFMEMLNATD